MKDDGTCTAREGVTLLLCTAMMYGGAAFVLMDNTALGIALTVINFIFWNWVAAVFVFFGKDSFPQLCFKTRLILSTFFWLAFFSRRFMGWVNSELAKNRSCT